MSGAAHSLDISRRFTGIAMSAALILAVALQALGLAEMCNTHCARMASPTTANTHSCCPAPPAKAVAKACLQTGVTGVCNCSLHKGDAISAVVADRVPEPGAPIVVVLAAEFLPLSIWGDGHDFAAAVEVLPPRSCTLTILKHALLC